MKERSLICVGVLMVVFLALAPFVQAQGVQSGEERTGKIIVGGGLGLMADTPDGTAFALGLSGDYYFTQGFSVGPLLQMGFTGDLFQLGVTAQAKYTFDIEQIPALKPHIELGVGFLYADLNRSLGRDEDDVGILFPLGLGAEYRLTKSISLDTNFLFNFTDVNVRDEEFFFTWLVGMRYRF
jgi:opacity protein-like surface antigen